MSNKVFTLLVACALSLTTSAQSTLPKFSAEGDTIWYQVKFKGGGGVLAEQGTNKVLLTASASSANLQRWAFFGSQDGFKMVSKAGNYVGYNGSRFNAVAKTAAQNLRIINGSEDGYFEIQRTSVTGQAMNQFGGTGIGKQLGEWSCGDPNNQLYFVPLTPIYPKFSNETESSYYFIKFPAANLYFAENGTDDLVRLAAADAVNSQMWKLVGTKDNFQLVSRNGNYAYASNKPVDTTEGGTNPTPVRYGKEPQAGGFKLQEAPNTEGGIGFEIVAIEKSGSKVMNKWGGSGTNNTIGFWNTGDKNNVMQFTAETDMTYPDFKVEGIADYTPANLLTLWYDRPATLTGVANKWMEYSLPIGNGQFGASLFGGVATDEILFNEKTLWTGSPTSYGAYQNFGSVLVDNLDPAFGYGSDKVAKNYVRGLDLTTGTGFVSYQSPDATATFTREYIASRPDDCIAVRYLASEGSKLNLRFRLQSGKPGIKAATTYAEGGYASFKGKLDVVSYNAMFRVVPVGGTMTTTDEGITVAGAQEVLLLLAGKTDFDNDNNSYVKNTAQLPSLVKGIVDAAAGKGWSDLKGAQLADHQKFMGRVDFKLAGAVNNIPTNELVDTYANGQGANARMLEQLYFAYGRYLEIASSRGIDLPSNLQGIWNNSSTPPWSSDIHANINVQMNYWPAETGNMSEMHMPFLNYVIKMATERPEWRKFAREVAKQTKGWTLFTENNIFGGKSNFQLNYVIANAWYCSHLWQHYRYTLDQDFLARAFPAMWTCAEFWMERLVLAKDGTYECPKEYSPEHGPSAENATAHSQQLVWELFDNVKKSYDILGSRANLTDAEKTKFEGIFAKLDKGLATETYTGNWGTDRIERNAKILREWKYSSYTASSDQNHRHMSHLMCLYPFNQVTPSSPYFDAAVNSMKLRGDASTGWSMGWKINLWARALNGDRAMGVLSTALRHSTSYGTNQYAGGIYYNLYDSHSPFQIDGNFGATAGVIEMLMQSATDTISVLPALPALWKEGSVAGLKAVGDFTVDIAWKDGRATAVTIVSNQGQPLVVRYPGIAGKLVTVDGEKAYPKATGSDVIEIPAAKGSRVTIDFNRVTGITAPTASAASFKVNVNGRHITTDSHVKALRLVDMEGRTVASSAAPRITAPDGHAFIVEATLADGTKREAKVTVK